MTYVGFIYLLFCDSRSFVGRMAISQIDWPFTAMPGQVRVDRFIDPYLDRQGRKDNRMTRPLYKDEQSYLQWNGDPFTISGGGGNTEYPGTVYLLPYWMTSFHQLL